jgi:hypothetical protein
MFDNLWKLRDKTEKELGHWGLKKNQFEEETKTCTKQNVKAPTI